MPPRIPLLATLRAAQPTPAQLALPWRHFSATAATQAQRASRPKKNMSHDPYIIAQRERKKAANLSRRAELQQARAQQLGDPVRGISTPFVGSFDTGKPLAHAHNEAIPPDELHLNYALKPENVSASLQMSKALAVPRQSGIHTQESPQYQWDSSQIYGSRADDELAEQVEAQRDKDHERAAEAIARITALENGSAKDRMRVNITRCIATFGRHNTDRILPPRAPPLASVNSTAPHAIRPTTNIAQTEKRIGPDTGSSEVQIAILTAKIRAVAEFLATRGKHDKHNKRNLRLLVHRRQKLLQYLRRKERGGPRWQHCIDTLGLTEGTWKGEISL